jgi:hypothetical protein
VACFSQSDLETVVFLALAIILCLTVVVAAAGFLWYGVQILYNVYVMNGGREIAIPRPALLQDLGERLRRMDEVGSQTLFRTPIIGPLFKRLNDWTDAQNARELIEQLPRTPAAPAHHPRAFWRDGSLKIKDPERLAEFERVLYYNDSQLMLANHSLGFKNHALNSALACLGEAREEVERAHYNGAFCPISPVTYQVLQENVEVARYNLAAQQEEYDAVFQECERREAAFFPGL